MNAEAMIDSLERFPEQLTVLLRGVSSEEATWKPTLRHWSILEIVCHLGDEEAEDFRKRLDLTLHEPNATWPGIDPEAWARKRGYNERDLKASLDVFLDARRQSISLLRSLSTPDWEASHMHTTLGPIRAGDLLAAWAAHDLLHVRQIVKRRFQLLQREAGDYKTDYAGQWGA